MKKTKEAIAAADLLEERATKILFRLFGHAQRQTNHAMERIDEARSRNNEEEAQRWVGKMWFESGQALGYHQAATRLNLDTSEFKFHDESSLPVWFFADNQTEEKTKQSDQMRALLSKEGIWFEEFQNGKDGSFSPEEWTLPCIMSAGQTFHELEEIKNWIDYVKSIGGRRVKILSKETILA